MPDRCSTRCPTQADLESFAAGSLAEQERREVEEHLTRCLPCAQTLEGLTRVQLGQLMGPRSAEMQATATSPVLETVMRNAVGGQVTLDRADPAHVLQLLDPPLVAGGLGTFAGYDVLEIAGRGGMGVVLRARDRTLDRIVALKVLLMAGPADERRFLEEARAVAAIPHDHIVAVHQAGLEKGLPYLVMPYHAEGTLEHWLSQGTTISARDAARVGLQVARALAATHARGILHRDIKPSNILLEQGLERVRLADFGLAQTLPMNLNAKAGPAGAGETPLAWPAPAEAAAGLTSGLAPAEAKAVAAHRSPEAAARMVAGTPQYMSPEQARGETIDARSDLFGLGAVLFRLLTGRTLHAGQAMNEVLRAAARCELPPVRTVASNVPPALGAIVDQLLAPRVEDRFESAEEVVAALEKFLHVQKKLRVWLARAALGLMAACVAASVAVLVLDWSGQTAIVNSFWCRRTGDGYYIRGRFGTYPELGAAVFASRPGEIIEVRFSGERVTDGFRAGGKPLTIRAAAGFAPTLVATNNRQPLILADSPLALEGLTLARRVNAVGFSPLLTAQSAPVFLLNCRLVRSTWQGTALLVRAGRLVPAVDENRPMRPMVVLSPEATSVLRNCVVLGFQAMGVGLKGDTNGVIGLQIDNSLFVAHRAFGLRPEPGFRAEINARGSVFVTQALLDLTDAAAIRELQVRWEDCAFDASHGALLRLNRFANRESLKGVRWTETNTIYAGSGAFVSDRRNARVESEAEWNELMRLGAHSHVTTPREVFADIGGRSDERLEPSDVNIVGLRQDTKLSLQFDAKQMGAGEAYAYFRRQPEYDAWRKEVDVAFDEWQRRRATSALAEAR